MGQRKGRNGLSIPIANEILASTGIEIERNKTEGCIIATHPSGKAIRRSTVTGCVKEVVSEWLKLKEDKIDAIPN